MLFGQHVHLARQQCTPKIAAAMALKRPPLRTIARDIAAVFTELAESNLRTVDNEKRNAVQNVF